MSILMFMGSVLSFLVGCIVFAGSKGAIHEIEALIFILISTVLFAGAAINWSINRTAERLSESISAINTTPDEPPSKEKETSIICEAPTPAQAAPKAPPPVQSWVEKAKEEIRLERS